MSVKKIFISLITIVACVLIGALVLNTLMPNVVTTLIDSSEDMIFKATGMSFDFNANSNGGDNNNWTYQGTEDGSDGTGTVIVEGFN